MMIGPNWLNWFVPLDILAISLLVGLWVRVALVPRLLRVAARTRWEGDEILIRAIRGPIVLWAFMVGAYLALEFSHVPEEVVDVSGRILKALWICSVTWVSASAITQLISHHTLTWHIGFQMTSLVQVLARLIILVLGTLIILDSFGVKIGSLLAALGIGSVAVALGLQETLANLFAGLYVSVSKNLRVGDYIKLESGEEGYVTDIGWREAKILMLPNNTVIIPNAKLGQSILTNYHLPDKELAVLVQVGVDYASDLAHVERVTGEVAKQVMQTVPGGVPTFEPFIRYHTFADFSINFTVILRAKEFVDQYLIKHEFVKRLHTRYNQEGITIPFPIRTIHMQHAERSQAPPAIDSRASQRTEVTRG